MSDPTQTVSDHAPTAPWVSLEPAALAEHIDRLPTTDRYQIGAEIARGGMGVVHRCWDRQLGRDLAAKVLLPGYEGRPDVVRRFIEEAQVAGQLQHPGVVPVHEMGRLPDGRLFFTMKLVEGRTLAEKLRERTDPGANLPALLKVFEAICQTLAYAHGRRVIHRDLKPHNVMVGEFGEVQVMDWGLAKILGSRGGVPPEESAALEPALRGLTPPARLESDVTVSGTVLGTLAYMPPEQARGETDRLDERCDVFGLGAILLQILTGKPPYWAPTTEEVRAQALAADLAPALERLAGCQADTELIDLCRRCLAPEREDRPRDARVVAETVAAYLAGVAERLRAAEIERAAVEARVRAERGKRRLTLALAGAVVVVLLLGVGIWVWLREAAAAEHAAHLSRVQKTVLVVNQALDKMRSKREEAAGMKPVDLAGWETLEKKRSEVLVAAEEARRTLQADTADEAARRELEELFPVLRTEESVARRHRIMCRDLEHRRFLSHDYITDDEIDKAVAEHGNDDRFIYNRSNAVAAYADTFDEYGIDVEHLSSAQAIPKLKQSPLLPQLAEALDEWWRLEDPGPQRDKLLEIVRAIDPHPFRQQLRTALTERDLRTLRELAGRKAVVEMPVTSILLLAEGLFDADAVGPAIDLLRRAQVVRPGEFWLNNKLGEYLVYRGGGALVQVEEATRFFTAALTTRPESAAARLNLGDALAFLGAHAEAQATYRIALKQRNFQTFTRTKLAIELALDGRHDEALAESRRAVAERPNSAWAQESHGAVCRMVGKYDEAVAAYQKAIELAPHVGAYRSGLGQALAALEQRDKALAAHREAYRLKQSPTTRANLIEALVRGGEKAEALGLAREAARLHPGSSPVLGALAAALDAAGQTAEAIETLREATARAPHDSGLWWRLAVILRQQDRLDEATAAIKLAIQHGPQTGPRRASLFQELARIHSGRKQFDAAVAACREALDCKPEDAALWRDLGSALEKQGNLPSAAQAYREALALKPVDNVARRALVELHQRQGRIDDALALCEDLPDEVRGEFDVVRARMLLDLRKPEEVLRVLAPYRVAKSPVTAQACALRGAALRQLDRLPEAIEAYQRAASGGVPDVGQVTLDLGEVLLEQSWRDSKAGDKDEARKNAANGHMYRGWGLRALGRFPEAIAAYRAAIETNPADPLGHLGLGETLRLSHQPELARSAYEAALKIDPHHASALRGLGRALRDLELLPEAVTQLQAACAESTDPAAIRVELGIVLRQLGRFREASVQFGKAKDAVEQKRCERLLVLQSQLEAFATGMAEPAAADLVDLADLCAWIGQPARASRYFRDAIRAGTLTDSDRLVDRAIQAVLASQKPGILDAERALLRGDARTWLRNELTRLTRQVGEGRDVGTVVGELARWQRSKALAGVREAAELAALPEAERAGWRAFWDEVSAVRRLGELK
jgi:serine/threonine-protein kinase